MGRPEIQKFAGALQVEFSSRIDSKIVLIDGKKLVDLMIDHNIGVSTVKSYEMKKIKSDYFEETA